jgi:hypothetical protein
VLDLRLDHDPQRQLLQVRKLRDDERLRVTGRTREIEKSRTREERQRAHSGAPFVFSTGLRAV